MCVIKQQLNYMDPIEMDCYIMYDIHKHAYGDAIINKNQINISFKDLVSCSVILFICKNGLAAFHYGAQSLVIDCEEYNKKNRTNRLQETEQYKNEMKIMLHNIVEKIGDIKDIYCFTPQSCCLYDTNTYKRNVIKDENALDEFFSQLGYTLIFSNRLSDLLNIGDKKIPWEDQIEINDT